MDGIIYTENGSWLQTYDEEGRMRLSDLGKEVTLSELREFCKKTGLKLWTGKGREHEAAVS